MKLLDLLKSFAKKRLSLISSQEIIFIIAIMKKNDWRMLLMKKACPSEMY